MVSLINVLRLRGVSVHRLDRCTLLRLPICFHPCHTKVLICTYMFHWEQAHYSFSHCHNLSFQLGIECRCVCPHRTGMLIPPITLAFLFVWCVWVRSSRPCISCLSWLSLFRLACACALLVWLPFLGAAGLLSFVAAARCFVVVVVFLLFALVAWCLRFGPLFPVPPSLPLCLLVFSGPVSVLLVPPSGYLVVSATVRLSYLWYGVSWLIGSCLHSAPWQQRLRPCVGLCPLHHVVVLFMCPSLRH